MSDIYQTPSKSNTFDTTLTAAVDEKHRKQCDKQKVYQIEKFGINIDLSLIKKQCLKFLITCKPNIRIETFHQSTK